MALLGKHIGNYHIGNPQEYYRQLEEWCKFDAERKSAESLEKWKKIYEEEQKNKQKK